jgi:hypothetical protein
LAEAIIVPASAVCPLFTMMWANGPCHTMSIWPLNKARMWAG